MDIKSPNKIQQSKSSLKQVFAIQSQNDFYMECEIKSQLGVLGEPQIYWWFKSAVTNQTRILKKPVHSSEENGTSVPSSSSAILPNKLTIISRIYIDCASVEHEGEYFCAAVHGQFFDESQIKLRVLLG